MTKHSFIFVYEVAEPKWATEYEYSYAELK